MTNTAERVSAYRQRRRASGLRAVQIWVPDVRQAEFVEACRAQSLALRDDPAEGEVMDWLEAVADTKGWT